jgi:hypothetical protein
VAVPRRPGESQRDYRARAATGRHADDLADMDPDKKINGKCFREMLAKTDRDGRIAERAFKDAVKMLTRIRPANLATIHEWETGQRIRHPTLERFSPTCRHRLERRDQRIRAHDRTCSRPAKNYFPHIWKDTSKARACTNRWWRKARCAATDRSCTSASTARSGRQRTTWSRSRRTRPSCAAQAAPDAKFANG